MDLLVSVSLLLSESILGVLFWMAVFFLLDLESTYLNKVNTHGYSGEFSHGKSLCHELSEYRIKKRSKVRTSLIREKTMPKQNKKIIIVVAFLLM